MTVPSTCDGASVDVSNVNWELLAADARIVTSDTTMEVSLIVSSKVSLNKPTLISSVNATKFGCVVSEIHVAAAKALEERTGVTALLFMSETKADEKLAKE